MASQFFLTLHKEDAKMIPLPAVGSREHWDLGSFKDFFTGFVLPENQEHVTWEAMGI